MSRLLKFSFVLILVLCSFQNTKAQMKLTQCAIDMVNGLDSLVRGITNTPICVACPPACGTCAATPSTPINPAYFGEQRTVLASGCAGTCSVTTTNTRFVFSAIAAFDQFKFHLYWPISTSSWQFPYYSLCLPCPAYFLSSTAPPDPSAFPKGCNPSSDDNFQDGIRIKKAAPSGTVLIDENIQNIKLINNPRLATPLDPLWPLISATTFTMFKSASGVLVDITLKDDQTYTGMIWHHYSPDGVLSSAGHMMSWKEPITCTASISGVASSSITPSGDCSAFQFSVNVSGTSTLNCSNLVWDHGDGSILVTNTCVTAGTFTNAYTYVSPGTYSPSVTIYGPGTCVSKLTT